MNLSRRRGGLLLLLKALARGPNIKARDFRNPISTVSPATATSVRLGITVSTKTSTAPTRNQGPWSSCSISSINPPSRPKAG